MAKLLRLAWMVVLICFALLLMGCPPNGGGFGSIYGYVMIDRGSGQISTMAYPEMDQEPLRDAEITVQAGFRTYGPVYTGADGFFEIGGIPSGHGRVVQVRHPSIRDYSETVTVYHGLPTALTGPRALFAGVGYYIIIGIDRFQDQGIERTVNGILDANLVYDSLVMDNHLAGNVRRLTGSQATKSNIRKAIYDAADLAKHADYLVVYYAGRGGSDYDFGDHIYPYDAKDYGSSAAPPVMVNDTDMHNWLQRFPGTDVTVILEAGSSGTFADGVPRPIQPLALRRSLYTVIASSRYGDPSLYYAGDPASVFTGYLVDGLMKNKPGTSYRRADANNNGIITARSLYQYIDGQMYSEFGSGGPLPDFWKGPQQDVVLYKY